MEELSADGDAKNQRAEGLLSCTASRGSAGVSAESPKIARSRERDLKSRTAEAGALSLEDDIDDADLQATLQAATDGDPEFVDVEAMQDTAGQDAFTLNLKPFGRFKPNTTSPKRKIEETGKEAEKEEGPPKSKGPKK